jgi:methyltransferase (TIGR00027 family)
MFTTRLLRSGVPALLFVWTAAALEPGQPSKTSIWTAAARAIGAKNPDPEFRNPDSLAIKFLGPRERAIMTDYPMETLDLNFDAALQRLSERDRGFVTVMYTRTKYIDDCMEKAVKEGASQIVILGAGFDSRGYRFQDRLRDLRFFEVDYGPTQEYKKQRVKEALGSAPKHVRYIPMDFTKDDLSTQLRKGGYKEREKTFFIWEGVTMYIPESSVRQTLQFVRAHSAPGSRIVFNYALARSPEINNPNSRYAQWGEPHIFGFPGDSAIGYVHEAGLEVVSDVAALDLISKYTRRADGSASLPPLSGNAGSSGARFCIASVPTNR